MTDQTTPAAECGPPCGEAHTYRLNECALSCAELHGSVADMSWTVPCPRCKAPADRPCRWTDGHPSGVACKQRWDVYLAALNGRTEPVSNASYPSTEGDRCG